MVYHSCLTQHVFKVALQESAPPQIRRMVLYYFLYEEYVDGFVWKIDFCKTIFKNTLREINGGVGGAGFAQGGCCDWYTTPECRMSIIFHSQYWLNLHFENCWLQREPIFGSLSYILRRSVLFFSSTLTCKPLNGLIRKALKYSAATKE